MLYHCIRSIVKITQNSLWSRSVIAQSLFCINEILNRYPERHTQSWRASHCFNCPVFDQKEQGQVNVDIFQRKKLLDEKHPPFIAQWLLNSHYMSCLWAKRWRRHLSLCKILTIEKQALSLVEDQEKIGSRNIPKKFKTNLEFSGAIDVMFMRKITIWMSSCVW